MDGIHVQGPARFGYIHNIYGNANDDHVALCANGTTRSAITHGTIEHITIDGIYCDNGYTGVRLLSRGDPVRNIRVTNIHGAFRYYAVSFTHHYPLREDMPSRIENVSVSNLFVKKSNKISAEELANSIPNAPLVWIEGGVECKNIALEKIFKSEGGKQPNTSAVRISKEAHVENITIRDVYEIG